MYICSRLSPRSCTSSVDGPRLFRRQQSPRSLVTLVVVASLFGLITGLSLLYCFLRGVRVRHKNPKYIPTAFLKRIWTNWNVTKGNYAHARQDENIDGPASRSGRRLGSDDQGGTSNGQAGASAGQTAAGGAHVDRNTSVRSVMTLPAYRQQPSHNEQVLGREGERDGIDVVVEMPTAEEAEALRENEMETLYQIRLARRQQINERDERQRQRREARERNDTVALRRLRAEANEARNNSLVDELRRDHERIKEERNRSVSAVSYGDLGVARHDGTRIRANSMESERIGLLSDSASIAAVSTHRRDRSGSMLSVDSDLPSPGLADRSRASSRADTSRLSTTNTRAGSSPELIEADVSDIGMPLHEPPGYEDVSLADDDDFAQARAATPLREPPPEYPGDARRPSSPADEASPETEEERGRQTSRPGVDGVAPQLPSLRLTHLPQIVIEREDGPRP